MYTISTNKYPKNIIRNIIYKLNEQQSFEMETETDTGSQRVVEPWMRDLPPPEGGSVWNIGRPVQCRNPLWEGSTKETATSASWAIILPYGNNNQDLTVDSPSYIFIFLSLKNLMALKQLFSFFFRVQTSTWHPKNWGELCTV